MITARIAGGETTLSRLRRVPVAVEKELGRAVLRLGRRFQQIAPAGGRGEVAANAGIGRVARSPMTGNSGGRADLQRLRDGFSRPLPRTPRAALPQGASADLGRRSPAVPLAAMRPAIEVAVGEAVAAGLVR